MDATSPPTRAAPRRRRWRPIRTSLPRRRSEQAADAALALARATHDRIAGLHAEAFRHGAGARRRHRRPPCGRSARRRRRRPRAQAAVSGVDSARAASEAAGHDRVVRAASRRPSTGSSTEKMVEPGNMAAPGTPLMRVEDTRGFRLEVRVDESRIGQIAAGAIVSVALDAGTGGAACGGRRHGGGNRPRGRC